MKTNIVFDISTTYLTKFWVSSYGPKMLQANQIAGFLKM